MAVGVRGDAVPPSRSRNQSRILGGGVARPVRSASTLRGVLVQSVAQPPATQVGPPSVEQSSSASSRVAREVPQLTFPLL